MTWAEIRRLPAADPFAYSFRFSYDVAIVMQLKQTIPYLERSWNPATKTWFIAHHRDGGWLVDALPMLKALALKFDEALLIDGNVTICLHTGNTTEQLQLL